MESGPDTSRRPLCPPGAYRAISVPEGLPSKDIGEKEEVRNKEFPL